MASDFDVDIKAESSKALRILYSYFVNGNKNLNFNRFRDIIGEGNTNQLRLCLETIYENKLKEDRNINCLAIIIDIDEVNKLYPTFRNLVSIVGSTSYPSGKVYEPHEKLRDLGFDGNYVYNNDPFRRMVSDIGGQVRTMCIIMIFSGGIHYKEGKDNKNKLFEMTRQHLMDLARHQAIQNNKLEKKIDQLTKRNVELKQQMRRIMKYIGTSDLAILNFKYSKAKKQKELDLYINIYEDIKNLNGLISNIKNMYENYKAIHRQTDIEQPAKYNIPKVMDLSLKHKRKADVTIKMSNTRQTSSPSGLPASFVVISFGIAPLENFSQQMLSSSPSIRNLTTLFTSQYLLIFKTYLYILFELKISYFYNNAGKIPVKTSLQTQTCFKKTKKVGVCAIVDKDNFNIFMERHIPLVPNLLLPKLK
ncbi:hypothetical protein GLOIN_2v1771916 [Rhizophagus irregularis DAOM 181602=DAOM 197198]|nr:hypothetical protein GLOIN_2v1771916 [Rhizophagus irregularis DAOM 181602=DAOM 197198]